MQEKSWLKSDNEDTLVIIKVKAGQNEDKFIVNHEHLIVKVSAPRIKGKANKKLIKLFNKRFSTDVILESGQTSTTKVFRLKKISTEQVLQLLENSIY